MMPALGARRLAAALAAALALGLPASAPAATPPVESRPSSIEVTGEAELEVAPDLAVLDFGVLTQAGNAAAAARQNSERMDAVLAAVRKALGAKARLTTGTYTLRPNYSSPRDGGTPRVTGYTASNVVQLKTAELARLGEIIDTAIQAGANQVQRIAFTLDDPAAARRDALREAALRARSEAEALAAALGLKPGAVHTVVEQDMGEVRPVMREAMMARAESAPTTPIEPGVIHVRARVVLTILIAR